MAIKYLKNNEIDFQRWDKCIRKSVNGNIYGYSWFLNIVSENWDALVDDNYETVMPLTCKKFLGFPILLQPPYATNLGVYSVNVISRDVVKEYIDQMISRYFYIDINLNKYNRLTSLFFKPRHDSIFELDLIPGFNIPGTVIYMKKYGVV